MSLSKITGAHKLEGMSHVITAYDFHYTNKLFHQNINDILLVTTLYTIIFLKYNNNKIIIR